MNRPPGWVLIALLIGPGIPPALAGWVVQPTNMTRQLYVVHAVSHEIVWAAGQAGQVGLTVNGGSSWIPHLVPTTFGLGAIFAFDDHTCVVADQLGRIYRTTDAGNTWPQVYAGAGKSINGMHFFDAMHGWATGDPVGGVYQLLETADGGLSWQPAPAAPPAQAWNEQGIKRSFDWVGTEIGMFGTNRWKIWRTTNGGASWDSVTTEMQWVPGLVMSDDGTGLIAGTTEGLETPMLDRSTDFGQTWTSIPHPLQVTNLFTFEWIDGTAEVWGATRQTGLFRSTNGGLDWTRYEIAPPALHVVEDLDFVDADTGWCVGSNGSVARIWRWYGTTDIEPTPAPVALPVVAFPNPFERDVSFASPQPSSTPIEIAIYDALGRCFWERKATGAEPLRWDGRDLAGRQVSSGAYFYRYRMGSETTSGRLIKTR